MKSRMEEAERSADEEMCKTNMPRGPQKIVQSLASANPWFNDNVFSKANRLLQ